MRRRFLVAMLIVANSGLAASGAYAQRSTDTAAVTAKDEARIVQPVAAQEPVTDLRRGATVNADVASRAEVDSSADGADSVAASLAQVKKEAEEAVPSAKAVSRKTTGGRFGPSVNGDTRKPIDRPASLGLPVWRVFFSLALVAGLMGLTFYLLKRFGAKMSGLDTRSPLQVKSRVHLDHKASLALIKVHEEELLLAVTPTGVTLLSKYSAISGEHELGEMEDLANEEPLSGDFQKVGSYGKSLDDSARKGRGA